LLKFVMLQLSAVWRRLLSRRFFYFLKAVNRRKITKVIIGVVVIGSASAYLLQQAAESWWVYYYSVDEFVESHFGKTPQSGGAEAGKAEGSGIIRLGGLVKADSIVYDAEKMQLDFELSGAKSSVPVRFFGAVPANFTDDKEILAEGKIDSNGVFRANKILTRCESKYKARLYKNQSGL